MEREKFYNLKTHTNLICSPKHTEQELIGEIEMETKKSSPHTIHNVNRYESSQVIAYTYLFTKRDNETLDLKDTCCLFA